MQEEDYEEDQDDQETFPNAPWSSLRPPKRQLDAQFEEARRYGEPDSSHDPTVDEEWPPYRSRKTKAVSVPWRGHEDAVEKISPS